jgi:uncharacterized membrane protein HdeD (DUF308 family)
MTDMMDMTQVNTYIGDWKGRLILGILALIFGFMFLLVPGFTLTLALILFGILLVIIGIVLIVFSLDKKQERNWRILNALEGILAISIGVITIVWPGLTALWGIYLVGFFAVFTGILQIVEGFIAPRKEEGAPNRWLLIISGIFSLILGMLFLLYPGSGLLALLWLVGFFLIIMGGLNVAAGLRLRKGPTAAKPA